EHRNLLSDLAEVERLGLFAEPRRNRHLHHVVVETLVEGADAKPRGRRPARMAGGDRADEVVLRAKKELALLLELFTHHVLPAFLRLRDVGLLELQRLELARRDLTQIKARLTDEVVGSEVLVLRVLLVKAERAHELL